MYKKNFWEKIQVKYYDDDDDEYNDNDIESGYGYILWPLSCIKVMTAAMRQPHHKKSLCTSINYEHTLCCLL